MNPVSTLADNAISMKRVKKTPAKFSLLTGTKKMSPICPLCRKTESLVRDDDLGNDGRFYSCHEKRGGCGSTFRITPEGECTDIF